MRQATGPGTVRVGDDRDPAKVRVITAEDLNWTLFNAVCEDPPWEQRAEPTTPKNGQHKAEITHEPQIERPHQLQAPV